MANWSELPWELLELISDLSNTSSDTRHFRSVCSSWRSSVPGTPPTEYFSPTIKFFSSQDHHFDVRLVKQTIFLLSLISDPTSRWMVKTEEHKPGVFRLLSPFSKVTSMEHLLDGNALDLANVNTLELGHEYVLRNIVTGNDHMNNMMSLYNMEYEKVALGKSDVDDNFIILSTHHSTGKLLMYRSILQEWAFLDDLALGYDDTGDFVYDWSLRYVDLEEYEGRFYAVTDSGRTVIIENADDSSVVVNLMVKSMIGGDKKCLIKSGGDLLLVDSYTCPVKGSLDVNAIDVYKLDKEDQKWVLLKGLEGRSIFISNFSSFSVTNLVGLKENCIYFSLKNFGKDSSEKKDGDIDVDDYCDEDGMEIHKVGVLEYDKGSFGTLEENFEDSKFLCWPPPSWINILR